MIELKDLDIIHFVFNEDENQIEFVVNYKGNRYSGNLQQGI